MKRLDFYGNDIVARDIARAHSWRLAAKVLQMRHPQCDGTIKLFRDIMRMHATDAVRLAKEFAK